MDCFVATAPRNDGRAIRDLPPLTSRTRPPAPQLSMSHAGHHGAVVNLGIGSALDDQETGKSSLYTGQRMINDRVVSRDVKLEFSNHCPAGRYRDGLNPFQRRSRETAKIVYLVEYLPDHMERRREIGTTHAEEKS